MERRQQLPASLQRARARAHGQGGVFGALRPDQSNPELVEYLRDPSSRPDIERSADAAQFRRTPQQPRVEPITPSARGPMTYSEPLDRSDQPPIPFPIPAPPGYEEGADGALRRSMGRELYWDAPADPFGRGGALMGDQRAMDDAPWRAPEQHFIGQRVTPLETGATAPKWGLTPPSAPAQDDPEDFMREWYLARERALTNRPSRGALSLVESNPQWSRHWMDDER